MDWAKKFFCFQNSKYESTPGPQDIADIGGKRIVSGELQAKLTKVFRDVFDDPELEPSRAMTARDIPEWDSLTHVRLVLTVEKAFGIKFTASQVGNMKNVGDLMDLIAVKQAAA